jgi:hypothetical protein
VQEPSPSACSLGQVGEIDKLYHGNHDKPGDAFGQIRNWLFPQKSQGAQRKRRRTHATGSKKVPAIGRRGRTTREVNAANTERFAQMAPIVGW